MRLFKLRMVCSSKRIFDIFFSSFLAILLSPLFLLLMLLVKLTSKGEVFYWSDRVGKDCRIFKMPKFRTMKPGTPVVATHLLKDSINYLTPLGQFLRRSSLDELPQLWSIFIGDMSFVGPRPALFNQDDLLEMRIQFGLDELVPGLTGWAQVNGRDDLPISVKVQYEVEYLHRKSFRFDMFIMVVTLYKVFRRTGVLH